MVPALRASPKFSMVLFGAKVSVCRGASYAIPTKDKNIKTLPLHFVKSYVSDFLAYARNNRDMTFYITPIGCGLAGYRRDQIRPFFDGMPSNCRFAETWNDPDVN